MSNCLFEALIQETIKNCSCTPEAVGFNLTTQSCLGSKILCKDNVFCKYFDQKEGLNHMEIKSFFFF